MNKYIAILLLFSLIACGGSSSDSKPAAQQQQEEADANYQITLTPIGSSTTGTGTISLNQELMTINLEIFGAPAFMTHKQALVAGANCARGSIVTRLDGDLTSETAGSGVYPIANSQGHYKYREVVAWDEDTDFSQYHVIIYGDSVSTETPVACGEIRAI